MTTETQELLADFVKNRSEPAFRELVLRYFDLVYSTAVRLYAQPGSKLRIEGTSIIRDWQAESPLIGGFVEAGPGLPLEPGAAIEPGPVRVQAEAFIMVDSLRSVDKDGRPYSDMMDQVMHASLQVMRFPKIRYRLLEMSFKGSTNQGETVQFEYRSRGELFIAGVTNEISIPVFVLPLDGDRLQISGRTAVRMSSFQITPPAPKMAAGIVETGDEVVITFSWLVGLRAPSEQGASALPVASQAPASEQPLSTTDRSAAQDVLAAGLIQLRNVSLSQVFAFYSELAQAEVDADEEVRRLDATISFTNNEAVTRAQLLGLLNNALREQAGVSATHAETNRVTMRLNR